jgi:hypothetical protein
MSYDVRYAVQLYKPPELRQTRRQADFKHQLSARITSKWRHNRGKERRHGVNYVRRTEIPAAGPLVPEHGALKFEILFRSRKYVGQTTGSDQIPAELIETVAETLLRREDLQWTRLVSILANVQVK